MVNKRSLDRELATLMAGESPPVVDASQQRTHRHDLQVTFPNTNLNPQRSSNTPLVSSSNSLVLTPSSLGTMTQAQVDAITQRQINSITEQQPCTRGVQNSSGSFSHDMPSSSLFFYDPEITMSTDASLSSNHTGPHLSNPRFSDDIVMGPDEYKHHYETLKRRNYEETRHVVAKAQSDNAKAYRDAHLVNERTIKTEQQDLPGIMMASQGRPLQPMNHPQLFRASHGLSSHRSISRLETHPREEEMRTHSNSFGIQQNAISGVDYETSYPSGVEIQLESNSLHTSLIDKFSSASLQQHNHYSQGLTKNPGNYLSISQQQRGGNFLLSQDIAKDQTNFLSFTRPEHDRPYTGGARNDLPNSSASSGQEESARCRNSYTSEQDLDDSMVLDTASSMLPQQSDCYLAVETLRSKSNVDQESLGSREKEIRAYFEVRKTEENNSLQNVEGCTDYFPNEPLTFARHYRNHYSPDRSYYPEPILTNGPGLSKPAKTYISSALTKRFRKKNKDLGPLKDLISNMASHLRQEYINSKAQRTDKNLQKIHILSYLEDFLNHHKDMKSLKWDEFWKVVDTIDTAEFRYAKDNPRGPPGLEKESSQKTRSERKRVRQETRRLRMGGISDLKNQKSNDRAKLPKDGTNHKGLDKKVKTRRPRRTLKVRQRQKLERQSKNLEHEEIDITDGVASLSVNDQLALPSYDDEMNYP